MIFFVLVILMLSLQQAKVAEMGQFHRDYLSPQTTTAVNGIFTLVVFLRHIQQYFKLEGTWDILYKIVDSHLGQMVVATFLFYSGYGIMESIRKKGFPYIRELPAKRFLRVLVNFVLAVLLFVLVQFVFRQQTFPIKQILLSFVAWASVGNSNWYIFVTLVLYLLLFVSFYPLRWWTGKGAFYVGAAMFTALTMLFVYSQIKLGRPPYTYNTAILFPCGCWWSLLRKRFENVIFYNSNTYVCCLAAGICLYAVTLMHRGGGIEWYSLWAGAFMMFCLLITMKVQFHNGLLEWIGNHVFEIYILQRLPMIVLTHYGLQEKHKYLFVLISFAITLVLATAFHSLTERLWLRKR